MSRVFCTITKNAKLIQVSRESEISEVGFELDDFPEILHVDEIKAELTRLSRENRSLRQQIGLGFDNIIGESPGILKIKSVFSPTQTCQYLSRVKAERERSWLRKRSTTTAPEKKGPS